MSQKQLARRRIAIRNLKAHLSSISLIKPQRAEQMVQLYSVGRPQEVGLFLVVLPIKRQLQAVVYSPAEVSLEVLESLPSQEVHSSEELPYLLTLNQLVVFLEALAPLLSQAPNCLAQHHLSLEALTHYKSHQEAIKMKKKTVVRETMNLRKLMMSSLPSQVTLSLLSSSQVLLTSPLS